MIAVDPFILTKAVMIGFSVAAPVGPIGVLCIEKTLSNGRFSGLCAGLGAATADSLYSTVAAFGITAVSGLLVAYRSWLTLIGGIVLVYLGLRLFCSKSKVSEPSFDKGSNLQIYATTFGLTLTNPMTIISFAAFFTGIGVGVGIGDYLSATVFVAGTFLGSAAWWIILSTFIAMLRKRITLSTLSVINKAAGLAIVGFGALAVLNGIRDH